MPRKRTKKMRSNDRWQRVKLPAHGRKAERTLGSLREMEKGRSVACMSLCDSTDIMKNMNFLSTKLPRLSGVDLGALCFAASCTSSSVEFGSRNIVDLASSCPEQTGSCICTDWLQGKKRNKVVLGMTQCLWIFCWEFLLFPFGFICMPAAIYSPWGEALGMSLGQLDNEAVNLFICH